MRRMILTALMINLILLSGCTGATAKDEARIEELREQMSTCAQVIFDAEMTVFDKEYVSAYTLRCTRNGEETVMELLSPQLISGVTARIGGRDAILEFDGLALSAGVFGESSTSPMALPAHILDALESGTVSQIRQEVISERRTLAFRVQLAENAAADFWLDAETIALLRAQLFENDLMIVSCEISNWQIEQ